MQKNPVRTPFAAGTVVSQLRVVGDHDLASFGARFGAAAVDLVVAVVLYLACLRLPGMNGVVALIVLEGVRLLYGAAQLQLWGRTLGMRAFRIRVVPVGGSSGGRLTAGQAWLRTAAYVLPEAVLGVGAYLSVLDCLWMLWDRPNQQTLHDKVARTVVVRG